MVFTNKHVVISLLVAPVLAILAWFAAGYFAGERPLPAQTGESYPLLEKSNCRWESGACDLENEDLQLTLALETAAGGPELVLRSSHALDGVVVGIGDPGASSQPQPMRGEGGDAREWRLPVAALPGPAQRIHLVAMAGGSAFFADAATVFLQPGSGG